MLYLTSDYIIRSKVAVAYWISAHILENLEAKLLFYEVSSVYNTLTIFTTHN